MVKETQRLSASAREKNLWTQMTQIFTEKKQAKAEV